VNLRQLDELPRDAPIMVVMRGAPGQTKSTTANKLKKQLEEETGLRVGIFSTDNIFTTNAGEYEFVPFAIAAAHIFEQHEMIISMKMREYDVYILDNTNLQRAEYLPYLREAMSEHFRVFVLDLRGHKMHKNIHGVPEDRVQMMLENSDKPYPAHIEQYYAKNQEWYDWIDSTVTNWKLLFAYIKGYRGD
jgi:hypothetical protein